MCYLFVAITSRLVFKKLSLSLRADEVLSKQSIIHVVIARKFLIFVAIWLKGLFFELDNHVVTAPRDDGEMSGLSVASLLTKTSLFVIARKFLIFVAIHRDYTAYNYLIDDKNKILPIILIDIFWFYQLKL